MPKNKKDFEIDKNSAREKREAEAAKRRKQKINTIITVTAILAVIAIVIGIAYYLIYVMPMNRIIIKVNDDSINAGYLIKRCLMSDDPEDINTMRYRLANELLIKQGAPEYGIDVTEADIDQAIKDNAQIASGSETEISNAEVQQWYRQQLNASQLSEKRYREYVSIIIMSQRLNTLLGDAVPNLAEQVHLHDIVVQGSTTAQEIKSRLESGEDFATIAREVSLDTETKENGGDMGWIPIDVLDAAVAFYVSDLELGEFSEPIAMGSDDTSGDTTGAYIPYAIFMVSERAVEMEIADKYLDLLKDNAIEQWISERSDQIKFLGQGPNGGYDSTTEAWILYQIRKLEGSRGITTTTTATTQ